VELTLTHHQDNQVTLLTTFLANSQLLYTFLVFEIKGLAIASTLVSLGANSTRKSNVSDMRELPRILPKAKTPPTLSQP